jgi:uncharacterized protein (TIGR00288 family)
VEVVDGPGLERDRGDEAATKKSSPTGPSRRTAASRRGSSRGSTREGGGDGASRKSSRSKSGDDTAQKDQKETKSSRGSSQNDSKSSRGSSRRSSKSSRSDKPRDEEPQRDDRPDLVDLADLGHDIRDADFDAARELAAPGPERNDSVNDERKIAMFCDLENIALGVRDSDIKKFDINLILERLLEKGKIIVKRAYCDWERYSEYKRPFHEAAIEMLDIPQKYYSGKNSADIKMVVDAMDLCYAKEHLDTFVLLSGDSDFSPLVSKLKENDKYVIGVGVKNSSSNLLVDNCDEFIYYEDVWRDQKSGGVAKPQLSGLNKKSAEAFTLMVDSIQALTRENKDVLWGSMIKQTMQRKRPSFNEGYYGYGSFSEMLEDAERKNILKLKKDQRSGTYIVTGFTSQR